jgi:hypothetical protein
MALVRLGERDQPIGHGKHRVAGDQGGCVAIRTEAEMDEIESRRQELGVSVCCGFPIGVGHRHRDDLGGRAEAFFQVGRQGWSFFSA